MCQEKPLFPIVVTKFVNINGKKLSNLSDELQILFIWCDRHFRLLLLPDDFCQHYEIEACKMLSLLDQIWLQKSYLY